MNNSTVALLVDGDNFSSALASSLLKKADELGKTRFRRVFCNARSQHKWDANPNFQTVHAGTGKNAADILLVVEALELAFRDAADSFVLASSDSDLKHLIIKLTELGKEVKWYGEEQKSSSEFENHWCFELIHTENIARKSAEELHRKVANCIKSHGSKKSGLNLSQLGKRMADQHVTKDQLPQKSWEKWLSTHPSQYVVDEGCVRLKS